MRECVKQDWFKRRSYQHFDVPVGTTFIKSASNPTFVAQHSWLPLIHFVKTTRRYKSGDGKTVNKDRSIMFASHRDACILSKYAFDLSKKLEKCYTASGLNDHVLAYRKLGRSNYNFSATALRFAQRHSPCVVLCFDITGFFDNLDHAILKNRLKNLLGVSELPHDWYAVFRQVTRFSYVELATLKAHPKFSKRIKSKSHRPIATIEELHKAGIPITVNANRFGIPQGTPISSAFSNLYMIEVDAQMKDVCDRAGALYQRYSDDILIVCPVTHEKKVTDALKAHIAAHKLQIKDEKTERALFEPNSPDVFQYLGFNISQAGGSIRPASLARQYRRAKRAIRQTKRAGERAIAAGKADKIYTKQLRKRFAPVGARNFSKYARRSAQAFRSKRITRQVLRFERMVDQAIRDMDSGSTFP